MKVYHIIEDFSLSGAGVRTVVKDLSEHSGISNKIITTKKESTDKVVCFESNHSWKYSKMLKQYLQFKTNENALFHIHGVWMYPQLIASKIASKNNTPFVLTPHGMYEPWLWEQGYIKKKLYFDFISKKHFNKASIIHAITETEQNNLHKIFPSKTRIEIIPNLISTSILPKLDVITTEEKYVLFLGRIHEVKGVKLLIDAFSKINRLGYKLKIAGPDSQYKTEIINYVNTLEMNNSIEFVGMVKGEIKFKMFRDAHVFIAPSYSEVMGMVNLEAAIMSTPVITTYQTGLYKEWNNEGGILINPNINELKTALTNALSWNESERNDRGVKLKQFVFKNYSWERNAYKWADLYRSLLD